VDYTLFVFLVLVTLKRNLILVNAPELAFVPFLLLLLRGLLFCGFDDMISEIFPQSFILGEKFKFMQGLRA